MVPKKALAISILVVLLSGTVSSTLLPASAQENYCPQSVEKKYCNKVIIIGAGIAGLGAAVELNSHKFNSQRFDDFVILEAQNRIGGRINTNYTWAGVPVDVHASWISGTYGNPITELAKKYNTTGSIILKKTDDSNNETFDGSGLPFDDSKLNAMAELYKVNFKNYMENTRKKMMDDKVPDISLQAVIDNFIRENKLDETQKKYLLFETSSYLGNEYGSDPSSLSLFYHDKIGYVLKNPDGTESDQVVFRNGYSAIIDGLVGDIGKDKILTSTAVQEVDYSNEGVTVKTDKGTFYGNYVISTFPLNILRNNGVKFVPDLPESKLQVIQKAQMGTLDKTYFRFPTVFWDDTKDYLNYVPPLNETGQWINFLNLHKVNGENILLAFNYGDYANNTLEKMPGGDEDIKKAGLKILDRMYPGKVPSSDQVKVLARHDAKNGGSYSSVPVGFVVPTDYDELAKPLTDNHGVNRVFFAGEATTWHNPGLTNGAYVTGIREANRLWIGDTGIFPSPYSQDRHWGMFPEYVMCKQGTLVAKASDNSPACVMASHVPRLVNTGWARDPDLA